jgi:hypothetical protein
VYRRGVDEEGTPQPMPRREPLPADPLLALGTILWVHFAAKPEVTEDWERFVLAWLDDIAGRLGRTPAWLRDEVLDITALIGEDLPGKPSAERARLLLAIPDDGIMRLVLARLKAEPQITTTSLRFALDILGCGPDIERHNWLKSRGLAEMRGMLAHASLSQLARDYNDALARAEAASRVVKKPTLTPLPSSTVPPSGAAPTSARAESIAPQSTAEPQTRPAESSQVFGIVSPNFAGTTVRSGKETPVFLARADLPMDDPYMPARRETNALIRAWHTFDTRSGNWSRLDVQEDLAHLRTLIDGYIARGTSTVPSDPTKKSPPRKG